MRIARLLISAVAIAVACAPPPAFASTDPPAAFAPPVEAAPCCVPADVKTLRDLIYIAQSDLKPSADVAARLSVLSQSLAVGSYRSWKDVDRAGLLSLIASTTDGKYWRSLIDEFAAELNVTVKLPGSVDSSPPSQPPNSGSTTPAPAATSLSEADIRRIVREELAASPAASSAAAGSAGSLPGVFSGGEGYVTLRSNSAGSKTQDNITDSYWGQISINGWDGGFRECQNYQWQGTPDLPYACWGGDSKATWSFSQFPKKSESASTPAVATYGQSYVIDGGFGQSGYDWSTGVPLTQGVLIAAQRGGQSLMLAISPDRTVGTFPTNRVFLRGAGSSPNPVEVVIDGAMRRLKSCNVGGVTVVCF